MHEMVHMDSTSKYTYIVFPIELLHQKGAISSLNIGN